MKILQKKIIYGCDGRGDGDSPYLTRYTLVGSRFFNLYVHIFHRSDADDMHDHPWPFLSLILWRGYIEETPTGDCHLYFVQLNERRRKWPGMILFRPARHIHRVELIDGKSAVSLVVTGPVVRKWGFWTGGKWEHWRSYFERMGC